MRCVAAKSEQRTRRSPKSIIQRRNARSVTGNLNSVRDGFPHVFESRPEALHLAILDSDCTVEWFRSQPETIQLPGGRSYTPDALIRFRSGRYLYREVKPLWRLEEDPTFDGRRDDIAAACALRGADFEVATEEFWRDPIRCRNASLIRHACRRTTRWECDLVREHLSRGSQSLIEIERETGLDTRGRFAALALGLKGIAKVPADRLITLETVVRLAA